MPVSSRRKVLPSIWQQTILCGGIYDQEEIWLPPRIRYFRKVIPITGQDDLRRATEFQRVVRKYEIKGHVTETKQPNQNAVEGCILELWLRWYSTVFRTYCLRSLWIYGIPYVAKIMKTMASFQHTYTEVHVWKHYMVIHQTYLNNWILISTIGYDSNKMQDLDKPN